MHSHHQAEEGSKSKAVRLLKSGTEKEFPYPQNLELNNTGRN